MIVKRAGRDGVPLRAGIEAERAGRDGVPLRAVIEAERAGGDGVPLRAGIEAERAGRDGVPLRAGIEAERAGRDGVPLRADIEDERLPYRASVGAAAYEGLRLPVAMLLDNVRSMYNVGAMFRTMDGAGAERLILCGITARPPMRAISKTALGAEEAVPWEHASDALAAVDRLRAAGYEIAAIETAPAAVDLFDWRPRFPVCLLFGHEVDGLGREMMERCDTAVRIPMLGRKHSLNVATAGGIVVYELLRKYRRMREGDSR